ncbi:MAG: response regulator transcription factor [Clostridia bacterium]|nr:response regulator transcription factor [Clostridia bacterium]
MKKILIVEDDEAISNLERDYLTLSGYEVTIARDGREGIIKAIENEYDLILLDIMLPGTDGFAICKRLREQKETPVLFVSAKKESYDKIQGFGMGANDYIVKPFDPAELVARVKAHIERYERLTSHESLKHKTVIEYGGLRIDEDARQVFKNGKELGFTSKEFEILLLFMKNPNIVFSREQIYDRVWGMDSYGDTAAVTVHLNRIREKIEDDSNEPKYLQTVWGAGYRFKT